MSRRFLAHPPAPGPALASARVRGSDEAQRREGLAEITDIERHMRERILAVLFTRRGERVMRPSFGAGLDAQIFEHVDPFTATALEYRIRASLEEEIAEEAVLEDVIVEPATAEGGFLIAIDYALREDRMPRRLEIVP